MILPDTNVFLKAFIPTLPGHHAAASWLDEALWAEESIALYVPIMVGLVRIATHSTAWKGVHAVGDVWDFVDSIRVANVVWIDPTPDYWSIFQELTQRSGIVGSTLTDVGYAALAIEHGCRVATFDQDFARIPGVRWFTPGSAGEDHQNPFPLRVEEGDGDPK